jgi:hypothetical protein
LRAECGVESFVDGLRSGLEILFLRDFRHRDGCELSKGCATEKGVGSRVSRRKPFVSGETENDLKGVFKNGEEVRFLLNRTSRRWELILGCSVVALNPLNLDWSS